MTELVEIILLIWRIILGIALVLIGASMTARFALDLYEEYERRRPR